MIGNLSRRERVLMVASVLIALVLGGWEFLVQPILDRNQLAADLVPTRERLLTRRQELIGRKQAIAQDLTSLNARLDSLSGRLLTGGTPPVAASELQKTVKEMATAAAMEIRSERILPPVERGELLEIPVEIAVSGEIRNLVDLLGRMETSPKLVTVQDVKIRVMNVSQPKDLLTTITLSGFIIPGKVKA